METEQEPRAWQQLWVERRGLIIGLGVLIVLVILLFCGASSVALWQHFRGDETAETEATPFPGESGGLPADQEPLVVGVSESSTISVTLDAPATLSLAGETFAVQPQVVAADGIWSPQLSDAETAVWVYGTIINYIVGIPSSSENRSLLTQLTPGDDMVLTTRDGVEYTFAFDSRRTVSINNREIFAQNRPGITLVLLGDREEGADQRLVVEGSYVVAESAAVAESNVVELGETAQLEDVQITVNGTTYLPDRPEAPAGFAFFLIDFQLQNVGMTALDTGKLQLVLNDELGNQFALNPIASQLGNFPPLPDFVNAGESVQATAGYQIPQGLASPTLLWTVARSAGGSEIQVSIPFSGGQQAAAGAAVSLQDVVISGDRTSIVLSGQVANLGEQPLVVTEEEVSLRTGDGANYLLLSTNPAFPWSVPPGQTLQFSVTYQRPGSADSATFTVLSQPFQLTGLR